MIFSATACGKTSTDGGNAEIPESAEAVETTAGAETAENAEAEVENTQSAETAKEAVQGSDADSDAEAVADTALEDSATAQTHPEAESHPSEESYPNEKEAALAALSERMEKERETVYVYRDFGETDNHYTQKSKMAGIDSDLVKDMDENWQEWQPEEYIRNLTHPVAEKGFKADLDAMLWADTCVLVLPCGRSAHTEAGWFAGKGLKTIVYMPEKQEPELMYKLFDAVVDSVESIQTIIAG